MIYVKFVIYSNFHPYKCYLEILKFEWIDKFHLNVIC